jgi:integrase
VPLSALAVLRDLPVVDGDHRIFRLVADSASALFADIRERAGIIDLHFHDTRHEAITRLAQKLNVLDLARMVGVRDLRTLMVYYNAKPYEIVTRLNV